MLFFDDIHVIDMDELSVGCWTFVGGRVGSWISFFHGTIVSPFFFCQLDIVLKPRAGWASNVLKQGGFSHATRILYVPGYQGLNRSNRPRFGAFWGIVLPFRVGPRVASYRSMLIFLKTLRTSIYVHKSTRSIYMIFFLSVGTISLPAMSLLLEDYFPRFSGSIFTMSIWWSVNPKWIIYSITTTGI